MPPQAIVKSTVSPHPETVSVLVDWVVELRGFELRTSLDAFVNFSQFEGRRYANGDIPQGLADSGPNASMTLARARKGRTWATYDGYTSLAVSPAVAARRLARPPPAPRLATRGHGSARSIRATPAGADFRSRDRSSIATLGLQDRKGTVRVC